MRIDLRTGRLPHAVPRECRMRMYGVEMNLFAKAKSLLLYGGLTREQYESVYKDATNENLKRLQIYAPIGCVVFLVLSLLGIFTGGVASQNEAIYVSLGVAMAILAMVAFTKANKSNRVVHVLVYLFMITLYAFSIVLSMSHTEYPAVSAIVFLTVIPLSFICRPLSVAFVTCCAAAATCMASYALKDPYIAGGDLWNVVSFGIVALVANIFVMRMKYCSLLNAREVVYLSETDTLTGLRNRNCYESRLEDYARSTDGMLVCAYADADGLHELNNTQGHDAGDKLLKAIANDMRELFGEEYTYRIGGDEFVAFVPRGNLEITRGMLEQMRARLLENGYKVSCGAAAVDASYADMRGLVRDAEKEMYVQKFTLGDYKTRVGASAFC